MIGYALITMAWLAFVGWVCKETGNWNYLWLLAFMCIVMPSYSEKSASKKKEDD